MPQDAVKFWQDTIQKAFQTETWKAQAEKNQFTTTYMVGEELQTFLQQSHETARTALGATGELKQK